MEGLQGQVELVVVEQVLQGQETSLTEQLTLVVVAVVVIILVRKKVVQVVVELLLLDININR
jgi:hypothetical protein